jgi:hypothetical protein
MNDTKRIGEPSSFQSDLTPWGQSMQEVSDAMKCLGMVITSTYRTVSDQMALLRRLMPKLRVWPEARRLMFLCWPQRQPLPARPFNWSRDVPRDDLAVRKFPPLVGGGRGRVWS